MDGRNMFFGKADKHSVTHFLGCFGIFWITLSIFNLFSAQHQLSFFCQTKTILWSAIISFGCGILWEIFDEINNEYCLNISFLDPRGGSVIDLIADGLGVLIGVGICLILINI